MICPVCEHQQDFGVECDVCGKSLGGLEGLGPPPVTIEIVEGLEATISAPLGDVPLEAMGELEVTRHAAVNVALDLTPDMVPNAQAAVGEIAIERVADLSEDRVPDDGVRTALSEGPVTCRYCRTIQAGGGLCERCGMKLPAVFEPPVVMVAGTMLSSTELKTRCRMCGAPAMGGQRCGDCGHEVPYPDA